MESPLLRLPGAVPADSPDQAVAAHYGEPSQEQRALAESSGAAVVDRSNRGVIRIAGPDRLRWVHSPRAQPLEQLPPHQTTEALLLSPNGHVEHHLQLIDDGEAVWAHVEQGTAAALVEFLDRMRFLLRVEVADLTESYAVVSGNGDGAGLPEGTLGLRDAVGTNWLIPRERLATVVDDLGARPAGL